MASKSSAFVAVFLTLNLAFFATGQGPISTPAPAPPPSNDGHCPTDTLKLKVCANVLNLLKLHLGVPSTEQCCPLIAGLADIDAAICLCTAIKANILGINLDVPVDLTLLLNFCGKTRPAGFICEV